MSLWCAMPGANLHGGGFARGVPRHIDKLFFDFDWAAALCAVSTLNRGQVPARGKDLIVAPEFKQVSGSECCSLKLNRRLLSLQSSQSRLDEMRRACSDAHCPLRVLGLQGKARGRAQELRNRSTRRITQNAICCSRQEENHMLWHIVTCCDIL